MSESIAEIPTIAIVSSNPIRILHVDDDAAFLSLAKQCLELQRDIRVDSAQSVHEAFQKLKTTDFDVIVSDYEMVEKNGLEFLQELRANGNKIPFVLFTGKSRDEVAARALNLGAIRYVRKGGAPDAVYAELAACIRQAREHAKAQEMLRTSEKRFRAIFDSSIDAIFVLDDTGKTVFANKAARAMFGDGQSALHRTLHEHFRQQFLAVYEKHMQSGFKEVSDSELAMTGKTFELVLQKTTNEQIVVELSFSAFLENERWVGVSIVRDITDRKKAESLLEESRQKFEALFSMNIEAMVFLDKDFQVVDINKSFTELFGFTLEEIKGKKIEEITVPLGHEEESEVILELVQKEPMGCRTIRRRKDGSEFNAALSGGPLLVDGRVLGFFFTYVDISDVVTVQEELDNALARVELQNEKLSVLGGFTRHDVRNKLALIQGNLYLARRKCNVSPELEKYLRASEAVIKNITDIFDFARTYEMIGSEKLVLVDVGEMFQNAVSLFSDLGGVEIENNCSGFEVLADSLLTEVFHNLIDNSLKYGEKTSKIKICAERDADGSSRLFYEDDGIGIDSESKLHLFKKGFGKGTGLGLYLVRKICEVYSWSVQEKGVPRRGVQFEFKIPMLKTAYTK